MVSVIFSVISGHDVLRNMSRGVVIKLQSEKCFFGGCKLTL